MLSHFAVSILTVMAKGDPLLPVDQPQAWQIGVGGMIFVVVVLLFVIGYGVSRWIWGEE